MSLGSSLSKLGSKVSSALSSKAGKFALTGAAVGGGTYVALTGVGAGVESFNDRTGLSTITNYITGNSEGGTTGKGVGTMMGIAVVIGIVLLGVFVIIPQFNKVRPSRNTGSKQE